MSNKLKVEKLVDKVFYLSPSQKVHSNECRYCQLDKDGWTKLESLEFAINQGYQTCRLCCSSIKELEVQEETTTIVESQSPLNSVLDSSTQSDDSVKSSSLNDTKKDYTSSKKFDKDHTEQLEKKRYKILAGNGAHQAIAEVQGFLMRPSEEGGKFKLILPDGVELDATFKNPRLKWLACNNDTIIGLHWFRGYPKMNEGKLLCLQIIAWDGNMPTSPQGYEKWEFIGLWTPQKNLTIQRSMSIKEIRSTAKESGFIKKFKYSFLNSQDFVASKKLWIGYVYKLICRREGDELKIQKVIPFACPRVKPVPKDRN